MSRYGARKTDENDKRVLAAGRGLGFYEEEYMDASGHMRQWLVNKLPLLDSDGEIETSPRSLTGEPVRLMRRPSRATLA